MSVRRHALAALTAALLLSSCSDDPAPRFSPAETSSAGESSAASEAQSPEEFIQTWFDLAVAMQNSGDTSELLASSRTCRPCQRLASQVEEIYSTGGEIKIAAMTVESAELETGSTFRTVVRASRTTLRRSESDELETLPANTNTYLVTLKRTDGDWQMKNYVDTPS